MKKTIIGVMGPGAGATENDKKNAYELGKKIAENGWILLSGGRNIGTMDAACRCAHESGGLVVGILPGKDGNDASDGVDIPIITGMGGGRNVINVLSCDVVVACGMGAGTLSEIGLAIKAGRKVIILNDDEEGKSFLKHLAPNQILIAKDVEDAIGMVRKKVL